MRLTDDQAARLIEAVRDAARTEILPLFRNLDLAQIGSKSAPDDLVTAADKASERAIGAAVARILPGAAVVGEEAVSLDRSVLDRIGTADQCVIIDPIDGTWNYAHGLSTFGVIVAVVEEARTVWGLLYDPLGDDWVVARAGHGAWYCRPGKPDLRLSVGHDPAALDQTFGFVGLYLYPRDLQGVLAQTAPLFRRTMSLRCSCHEYRMLAHGNSDFSLNGMLNAWDHAAGVLAVEEAGGTARLLDGTPYAPTMTEGRLLLAKSAAHWDALAEVFAGVRD